jgi:hypothetical protein
VRRRTAAYTFLALVAFAANSILCRLALTSGGIDPASFTAIRLVTGAAVLLALVGEPLTGRLVVATGVILGGIAIALWPAASSAAT